MSILENIFMMMPYYLTIIGIFVCYFYLKKTGKRFKGVYRFYYFFFFIPAILFAIISLFIFNPASGSELEVMVRVVKICGIITPIVTTGVMTLIYN